jgi:hypothetical protein
MISLIISLVKKGALSISFPICFAHFIIATQMLHGGVQQFLAFAEKSPTDGRNIGRVYHTAIALEGGNIVLRVEPPSHTIAATVPIVRSASSRRPCNHWI